MGGRDHARVAGRSLEVALVLVRIYHRYHLRAFAVRSGGKAGEARLEGDASLPMLGKAVETVWTHRRPESRALETNLSVRRNGWYGVEFHGRPVRKGAYRTWQRAERR